MTNADIWRTIAWWLEFPQLSKLWATGDRWMQRTIGPAPGLKIVGYCDPVIFEFTKLSVLDLSDDAKFDLTAITQPLPSTITSLSLWLSPNPQRPLAITNFPAELRELTIYTETLIEFSVLPRTLTTLNIEDSGTADEPLMTPELWSSFLTNLVSWLPELQTLVMPGLPVLFKLPTTLPPGLTRLEASCCMAVNPRDILLVPAGITELDLHWKPQDIPYLPRYLTRLTIFIDYNPEPLTAEHIGMLPQSITQLHVGYTGESVVCFERLPLRNWTLYLKSSIDFQGNFPQLTRLEISGRSRWNQSTVYVPATVQVLRLSSFKDVVFPPELRLREFSGQFTHGGIVGDRIQLSECTSYNIRTTALASITAIAIELYPLNPVYLRQLVMSVSNNVPLTDITQRVLCFTNLTELILNEVKLEADYTDTTQTHLVAIQLPATLTRLHIDGRYTLPNLELPLTLVTLYLRRVNIPPQVLLPLQNLRTLIVNFGMGDSWSLIDMMTALDQLPLRMTNIHIYNYQFFAEVPDFSKRYMAKRSRYLAECDITERC